MGVGAFQGALFAIAGTYKAILFGSSALVAVMLGIITAIGSAIFVALNETTINSDTTVVMCVAAIVVIHMVSIRFRLYLKPALPNLDHPEKGE